GGGVGLYAGVQHEGPWRATELERCTSAICVALVLAQVHVDPADELSAQDHVRDERRVIVGSPPRQRDVSNADLGVGGAGARCTSASLIVGETAGANVAGSATGSVSSAFHDSKPRETADCMTSCGASPTAISVVRDGMHARRWNSVMSRIIRARSAPSEPIG